MAWAEPSWTAWHGRAEPGRASWTAISSTPAPLDDPPVARNYAEENDLDLALASRFCGRRRAPRGLSRLRRAASRVLIGSASRVLPAAAARRHRSDERLLPRAPRGVDVDRLRPRGFKILLEILVRAPDLRGAEVPFVFGERHAGESKASLAEASRYLGQLGAALEGTARGSRFGPVGLTGLAVNTALLALLTVSATPLPAGRRPRHPVSTPWNFALTERWVFRGRKRRHAVAAAGVFFVVNNLACCCAAPMLFVLTSVLGMHYLSSNLIALAA